MIIGSADRHRVGEIDRLCLALGRSTSVVLGQCSRPLRVGIEEDQLDVRHLLQHGKVERLCRTPAANDSVLHAVASL